MNQKNGRKMGEVGPGKPPVEHQFQPGHPGGPGRPKGSKSMKKVIKEALFDNDGEVAQEIVANLVKSARYGNMRAIKMLIDSTK